MRTGGLEAAPALHVVNNVVAFLLLAPGVMGTHTMGNGDETTPVLPAIQLVLSAGWLLWIELLARRHRIDRTIPAAA